MFLPIGDYPNPRGFTPWVTRILIGINILAFFAVNVSGDRPLTEEERRDPVHCRHRHAVDAPDHRVQDRDGQQLVVEGWRAHRLEEGEKGDGEHRVEDPEDDPDRKSVV